MHQDHEPNRSGPLWTVTATRVATMVIEAGTLAEAETIAKRQCQADGRRLLSIEPYTEEAA